MNRTTIIPPLTLLAVLMVTLTACALTPQPSPPAAEPPRQESDSPIRDDTDNENSFGGQPSAGGGLLTQEACLDPLGCVTLAPGEPLKLAGVFALTEADATLGVDSQYGAQIAVTEQGTVAGHPLQLTVRNGGCSAETGQTVAAELAKDKSLVAIIGHNCSTSCWAAAPIYNEAGLTMVSPSCTAPQLTAPDSHPPNFLRVIHNDTDQAKAIAELAYHQLGLRTAATLHDGSLYAERLEQAFVDTFTGLGGQVPNQLALNRDDTDFRDLLAALAEDKPELLYYPIFLTGGMFITAQARQTPGLEETVLAGADALISDRLVCQTEGAAEGMYLSGMAGLSGANYARFKESYQRLVRQDALHDFHAHAFDATRMVLAAIEQLAQSDADGNTVIGRQALRDTLYATREFKGLTGTLTCNEFGDCADPNIVINQIQNGQFVPVYTLPE